MDPRSHRGIVGEDAAAAWYADRGFHVLARNWRCPAGELDLVLLRGSLLVICEVKARRGDAFGGGFAAVGWDKQRRIRRLAEMFLDRRPALHVAVRFDVASVAISDREASVEVFEDAF